MSTAARRHVVVVSPHFDDVPLSLGQSLLDGALSRCRVQVRVAFSRTNWTGWVHPTPGRAPLVAGAWRRLEEGAAAARFGYRWRTGGWSESVLRTGTIDTARFIDADRDLSGDPLLDELEAWMRSLPGIGSGARRADLLLVSAGLGGHLDHRLVALAARRLVGSVAVPVGFYEDRPYAAYLDPSERRRQLPELGPDAECVEVSGPVSASTQRWIRRCYPSQMNDYFVDAMARDRSSGAGEQVWFAAGERPGWL